MLFWVIEVISSFLIRYQSSIMKYVVRLAMLNISGGSMSSNDKKWRSDQGSVTVINYSRILKCAHYVAICGVPP